MADSAGSVSDSDWLKTNLDNWFANDQDVFVATDLLWYPVEFHPEISIAPDVCVVVGRPKRDRDSYRQWDEGNIAPQVVFDIRSIGTDSDAMMQRLDFYERYGVEEYYHFNPEALELTIWLRDAGGGNLTGVDYSEFHQWMSPLLGLRFEVKGHHEWICYPGGQRFASPSQIHRRRETGREIVESLFRDGKRIDNYELVKLGSSYTIDVTEADGVTYVWTIEDDYRYSGYIEALLERGVRIRELM